ncbi:MAG TPA: neutral/alkaline non-lysosomal ceramidase N-terminal domain-containing protein [Candidatus Hydrogenedentes bacterium]|nr:neutral/alkaline non-lysosomal ceramidase N-terminal domain-containing protein [Candidatus Hydrogenedentota bacterium]
MHFRLLIAVVLMGGIAAPALSAYKVGAASVVITPEKNIWLAGYAARKAPAEGKEHDLYAKAIAIEDATGARFVLVTTDLVAVSRDLMLNVSALAQEKHGIARERFMITASHTHSGPVTNDRLYDMYGLDETQGQLIAEYTATLPDKIMAAISHAIEDLEPCTLHWGQGTAGFGKNRRQYAIGGVSGGMNPIGPVDHDVPVLLARNAEGNPKAVLFGYACHNTTLSWQFYCGDYAGFAQEYIERSLPGATALFVSGCGADQNPLPRGTVALAKQYGGELSGAVLGVVGGESTKLTGEMRGAYSEIPLALTAPPTREEIEKNLQHENVYEQRRAKRLLKVMDEKGALDTTYPYPVQVWQFGDELQLTALGGEVVVDYALLIKHELGRDKQFVIGYANDVCAYIPSLRILQEGGYEGGGAMLYYGFYGPWAPEVQDHIMKTVHELTGK